MLIHRANDLKRNESPNPPPGPVRGTRASNQLGFNLIENLIAIVVLSVGLLGLAGLQAESIKSTNHAQLRTQASQLIKSMSDRMRANRDAAISGRYNTTLTENGNSNNQLPGKNRVGDDISAWWSQVTTAMPGARAEIAVREQTAEITVRWINTSKDQSRDPEHQHVQIRTKL